MKKKRTFLILAILFHFLVIAPAAEPPPSEPIPIELIANANPTLAGIEGIYFDILLPEGEAKKNDQLWKKLRIKVRKHLNEVGIKIVPDIYDSHGRGGAPELKVRIDTLELGDQKQYIFHVETSLARIVYLSKDSKWATKADVWKTKPVMESVSVKDMPLAVTEVVAEQVEAFINAWRAANPAEKQPADVNATSRKLKNNPQKPITKTPVSKSKYVASKNSKVFHYPQCSFAKGISPKNLVRYKSKENAIQAGKRPCKRCKP